jgi:16S rRNA (guanine527-N7)-methyltransferase
MDEERTLADLVKPEAYPRLELAGEPWTWFADACRDAEIPVEPEQRRVLEALYSHLAGVNAWLNLTRLVTPMDYLKFHVFDSLTALPFAEELTDPGDVCIDLGSGGGYPGLPLMTWLPDRTWILVESRGKKAAFLREAVRLTPCSGAEVAAFRGREVRSARPDLAGRCAFVVARAVGRADRCLAETADMLAPGGWLLMLKGPTFAREERDAAVRLGDEIGFEMTQEGAVNLDPDDPERLLVLFRRTRPRGRRPGRGRRRRTR